MTSLRTRFAPNNGSSPPRSAPIPSPARVPHESWPPQPDSDRPSSCSPVNIAMAAPAAAHKISTYPVLMQLGPLAEMRPQIVTRRQDGQRDRKVNNQEMERYVSTSVESGGGSKHRRQRASYEPSGSDQHSIGIVDNALGSVCRSAASHTDRESLGDVLGNRQQLRHGIERPCAIILIQAGDDDALSHVRHLVAHRHEFHVEELRLRQCRSPACVRQASRESRSRSDTSCDLIFISLWLTM